jgi:hypothetical protein
LPNPVMGSVLVVVSAPSLQLRARIVKAHEPMCIQAFPAQLAVERLDKHIAGRLPRPREVERHAMRIGPEIQVTRDEFTALVNAYAPWIADGTANPLERAHHTRGHFPGDEAAIELLYLVLNRAVEAWKRPPREWCEA